MATISAVLRRGEPRFNIVGQKLPDSLYDTDEQISPGLVRRLRGYALKQLASAGFEVGEWDCEVYTTDSDRRPAERVYCVEFINQKGGMLGLQGIMTYRGHPSLDHGLTVDCDRTPPSSNPIPHGKRDGGGL
ncbi:hypothetical protein [Methylorubrum extorquens]|uniref:hypothetical protein n=1 Tax=Methylorubrum extorquens TaxID=408 RepID=UPI0022376CEA|nr:hypothetical protein [Methylorubrum extorquens]UYW32470.1 hypothetical protein OKB92_26490 [Methylorubrum extorquens]